MFISVSDKGAAVNKTIATVLGGLILLAACNDGGSTAGTGSVPSPSATTPTATTPTSTSATTSSSTTTTSSTSTTTSTTVPVEVTVKAQIVADYTRIFYESATLLENPSLDGLDQRLATIAEVGSESFKQRRTRVEELVALGDRLVRNDPDLYSITVENVELVGSAPYTEAIVKSCQVDNRKQITPAENSPIGSVILVGGSDTLDVGRLTEKVRLVGDRWVEYAGRLDGVAFQGVTTCPPE